MLLHILGHSYNVIHPCWTSASLHDMSCRGPTRFHMVSSISQHFVQNSDTRFYCPSCRTTKEFNFYTQHSCCCTYVGILKFFPTPCWWAWVSTWQLWTHISHWPEPQAPLDASRVHKPWHPALLKQHSLFHLWLYSSTAHVWAVIKRNDSCCTDCMQPVTAQALSLSALMDACKCLNYSTCSMNPCPGVSSLFTDTHSHTLSCHGWGFCQFPLIIYTLQHLNIKRYELSPSFLNS